MYGRNELSSARLVQYSENIVGDEGVLVDDVVNFALIAGRLKLSRISAREFQGFNARL